MVEDRATDDWEVAIAAHEEARELLNEGKESIKSLPFDLHRDVVFFEADAMVTEISVWGILEVPSLPCEGKREFGDVFVVLLWLREVDGKGDVWAIFKGHGPVFVALDLGFLEVVIAGSKRLQELKSGRWIVLFEFFKSPINKAWERGNDS